MFADVILESQLLFNQTVKDSLIVEVEQVFIDMKCLLAESFVDTSIETFKKIINKLIDTIKNMIKKIVDYIHNKFKSIDKDKIEKANEIKSLQNVKISVPEFITEPKFSAGQIVRIINTRLEDTYKYINPNNILKSNLDIFNPASIADDILCEFLNIKTTDIDEHVVMIYIYGQTKETTIGKVGLGLLYNASKFIKNNIKEIEDLKHKLDTNLSKMESLLNEKRSHTQLIHGHVFNEKNLRYIIANLQGIMNALTIYMKTEVIASNVLFTILNKIEKVA